MSAAEHLRCQPHWGVFGLPPAHPLSACNAVPLMLRAQLSLLLACHNQLRSRRPLWLSSAGEQAARPASRCAPRRRSATAALERPAGRGLDTAAARGRGSEPARWAGPRAATRTACDTRSQPALSAFPHLAMGVRQRAVTMRGRRCMELLQGRAQYGTVRHRQQLV